MLALLLRLALATIRNSREIIITDAVGAPSPFPLLPLQVQLKLKLGEAQATPCAQLECLISPNVTTHASFGLQMSSDKCANYVCSASVCVCVCVQGVCMCVEGVCAFLPACQVKIPHK